MTDEHEITGLLVASRQGDRTAFDRLFTIVYDELRRRAHFELRQAGGHSLVTTGLVHEAYLKLVGAQSPAWEGRLHFYRVAARVMRQIVIDRARNHLAAKRGGGCEHLDIDRAVIPVYDASEQLVALDLALHRLEAVSPRSARVIELTYFVGLSINEAGDVVGTSARTVKRLRQFGRAFLHAQLANEPASAGDSVGTHGDTP